MARSPRQSPADPPAGDPAAAGRLGAAVGGLPVVGDLVRSAGTQAQWVQDVLEQNARLVGQFPATMKSFNDALERFNQTVSRLDRAVDSLEAATRTITGPIEKVGAALDPQALTTALEELPATLRELRTEAIPALRAATDTPRQVARLQRTVERVVHALGEVPGLSVVRRIVQREDAADPATAPDPAGRSGEDGRPHPRRRRG